MSRLLWSLALTCLAALAHADGPAAGRYRLHRPDDEDWRRHGLTISAVDGDRRVHGSVVLDLRKPPRLARAARPEETVHTLPFTARLRGYRLVIEVRLPPPRPLGYRLELEWFAARKLLAGRLVALPEAAGEASRVLCSVVALPVPGSAPEVVALLADAVTQLRHGRHLEAEKSLRSARLLAPELTPIQTLLQICGWQQTDPTEHVEQLITAGRALERLAGPPWAAAGVPRYGRALRARWLAERQDGEHAARGDAAYRRDDMRGALTEYGRIRRTSAFYSTRRRRLHTARRRLTEQLLAEADQRLKDADIDGALARLTEAQRHAPPSAQQRLLTQLAQARRETGHAANLRKARQAHAAGDRKAALRALAAIPSASMFHAQAQALRAKIEGPGGD